MKLSEKLDRIREATPKMSPHGQLYSKADQKKRRYKRVTLYTLFRSDENTHLIRDHVFEKNEYWTPKQWHAWFAEHLPRTGPRSIVAAVLSGLALRTGKHWQVERIIGWAGDAKHSITVTGVARKRHKAKSQRRKNG